MKDTILIISPILALIISAITVVINLSIRGEDNFQKTLDLLNAHTEYGDDDRGRCQWVVAMSSLNASVGVR